ncbi:hypothetical protein DAI22_12g173100 [Oryza sativa Japonica Group]|nr:hypothetical protein DAI22_12g173100 [Oryza sativa Japonica Group]
MLSHSTPHPSNRSPRPAMLIPSKSSILLLQSFRCRFGLVFFAFCFCFGLSFFLGSICVSDDDVNFYFRSSEVAMWKNYLET